MHIQVASDGKSCFGHWLQLVLFVHSELLSGSPAIMAEHVDPLVVHEQKFTPEGNLLILVVIGEGLALHLVFLEIWHAFRRHLGLDVADSCLCTQGILLLQCGPKRHAAVSLHSVCGAANISGHLLWSKSMSKRITYFVHFFCCVKCLVNFASTISFALI